MNQKINISIGKNSGNISLGQQNIEQQIFVNKEKEGEETEGNYSEEENIENINYGQQNIKNQIFVSTDEEE